MGLSVTVGYPQGNGLQHTLYYRHTRGHTLSLSGPRVPASHMTSSVTRWLPALAAKLTFTALKHSLHLQATVRGEPRVADQLLPAPRLEAAAAENGSNSSALMYGSRQQRLVAVCSTQQQYLQAHASRAARVANSTWSMLERATSSACKLTRVASDTITMNGDRAAFRLCTRRLLCLHEDACRLPSPSHLRIFTLSRSQNAEILFEIWVEIFDEIF